MREPRGGGPPALLVVFAFGTVYLVWGSTYLAIRWAIETLPPFVMAGARHLTAGLILYAWVRARGVPRPERRHWVAAGIIGFALLVVGNGSVVWAEQRVASGLAALLVATVSFWMVLFDWVRPNGVAPTAPVVIGLVVGFGGVALLVSPSEFLAGEPVDLLGTGALLLAAFGWAAGSVYSQRAVLPRSAMLATAMEMIAGGALLLVLATLVWEWPRVDVTAVSAKSALSLGYLVVFGSLLAFTAYIWMLRVATPAHVSTYAYVNPAVAMFLGWALAGEPVTARALLAAALILASVVVILGYRTQPRPAPGTSGTAIETAGE